MERDDKLRERKAFEARWRGLDFNRGSDGEQYGFSHVEAMWRGWLSRAEAVPNPDTRGDWK